MNRLVARYPGSAIAARVVFFAVVLVFFGVLAALYGATSCQGAHRFGWNLYQVRPQKDTTGSLPALPGLRPSRRHMETEFGQRYFSNLS